MKKFFFLSLFQLTLLSFELFAQVENVPLSNPVYHFLKHLQVCGVIEGQSFFKTPFTRGEIKRMLVEVQTKKDKLNSIEKKQLQTYLEEFDLGNKSNAVLIPSETDSVQVLSTKLFSNDDKFIYRYNKSPNEVFVKPLGSLRSVFKYGKSIESDDAFYGNLGFRVFGTIDSCLGFYLQATNGKFISGSKSLGIQEDKFLSNSIKFTLLNSDFDLVESHVRFQYKWFSTGISRETRFLGSGVNQKLVVSDNAPPMDEFFIGANFRNFKYNFSNYSLIAQPKNPIQAGSSADIPPKYLVLHSATFQFKNWNLTYFQTITYSGRSVEIAYLNPFTFLKSVEHSLHDRDKAGMGLSFEWNIFPRFQLLGSWMLEDLIFSEIGKNFWGNKTAWNIGAIYASPFSVDFGFEYTRVEPYMFTHFNNVNNRTHDGRLIGTYVPPNSDETTVQIKSFILPRYPVIFRISYLRHGDNVIDSTGKIIRNVGGDFNINHSATDDYRVRFLDGVRNDLLSLSLYFGFEIIRNFNLQFVIDYRKPQNQDAFFVTKFVFRFEDF
ncbi:hypothetical protein D9V84_03085 [Bacteroidetes/Chlorobi group bacterium Naka2016]|jgi:hypothetical protein|nr:MAG: hypothetical protein D9V84_03085 [Bacteroidetes/Chlorobi group bacterium Naka2016]